MKPGISKAKAVDGGHKMPDFCDIASEAEAQYIAAALSVVPTSAGRGPIWREGKAYCRECGNLIAAARVKALPNTELCIECARERE